MPKPKKSEIRRAISRLDRGLADLKSEKRQQDLREALYNFKPLPTQQKYLDAVNSGAHIVLYTGGNKVGKTAILVYDTSCESLGYQPHDSKLRPVTDFDIALLVRDYDNAAVKIYREGFLTLFPKDCVKVVQKTVHGAPRILRVRDPRTGHWGKNIHIFTHDQDPSRGEGGSLQAVAIDEPCPQRHFHGLSRGLMTTGGQVKMTMTLLEDSAWVWNQIYQQAGNQGGPNKRIFAFLAEPDENKRSKGGYLPDQAVEDYRKTLPPHLWEARVKGHPLHLVGRVYRDFNPEVHVLKQPLHTKEEIDTFPKICVVDPHPRKPWAMIWAYIAPGDIIVIYDEWPNVSLDKLFFNNFKMKDYAGIVNSKDWPTWGLMDPNGGLMRSVSTGMTFSQELTAATGVGFITEIDDSIPVGHMAVAERLNYNPEEPLSIDNQPSLFLTSNCSNTIHGLANYVWEEFRGRAAEGKGPKTRPQEAEKDFPDCVRYLCVHPVVKFAGARRERVHHFRRPPRQQAGRSRLSKYL